MLILNNLIFPSNAGICQMDELTPNTWQKTSFNITLPNKSILNVNLSMQLLHESKRLEKRDNHYEVTEEQLDVISETTSRPTTTPNLKRFNVPLKQAIEEFQESLLEKEVMLGGVIESDHPFYRHYELVYPNYKVPIRCTYTSKYEDLYLDIECYEFRQYHNERLLSNGEVELVSTKENIEEIIIEDSQNYVQTMRMRTKYNIK